MLVFWERDTRAFPYRGISDLKTPSFITRDLRGITGGSGGKGRGRLFSATVKFSSRGESRRARSLTLPLAALALPFFFSVPLAFAASSIFVPRDASALLARTLQFDAALHRAAPHIHRSRVTHAAPFFSPLLSSLLSPLLSSPRSPPRALPPRAIRPTSTRDSSRRGRGGRASPERNEPRPLGEVYSCSRPSTSSGAIVSAREVHARARVSLIAESLLAARDPSSRRILWPRIRRGRQFLRVPAVDALVRVQDRS